MSQDVVNEMARPTLSVIVPVYNVEAYLAGCVESILAQAYADYELILVDDGSPDRSGALCDGLAARDARIRVLHKPNGGLSDARNAGLDIARGRYVTFIDSDDAISSDCFALNMEKLLADDNIDLLIYPVYVHYGTRHKYLHRPKPGYSPDWVPVLAYWYQQQGYLHSYAHSKFCKTELFHHVRFPVGKYFEDILTLPILLEHVKRLYVSDAGIYYYYQRPLSITVCAQGRQTADLLEGHLNLWLQADKLTEKRSDKLRHYLMIADIQISALVWNREAMMLPQFDFSMKELWSEPISLWMKLKDSTLVWLGIRRHCLLWSILNKIKRLLWLKH
jgi:hypothetical protein